MDSLDAPSNGDSDARELPETKTAPPDPERDAYLAIMQACVTAALSDLTPRDRLRLAYYYVDDLTLAQIGKLLAAYFDQALGADEAAGYELHFSTCPRCREQLAVMARASTGQMVQPDLALEPAVAAARPVPAIALDVARIPGQAK